jgi:GTP-binding protein SAR1
VVDAQ